EELLFPYSGKYEGSFFVAGHTPIEYKEEGLRIEFERTSGGGWNVHGRGENEGTPFVWTGLLSKDHKLEVQRKY
ncbi:unnamed protein product, partial [Laminaria digitata]